MCELCSTEFAVKKAARANCIHIAERLELLAKEYRALSDGTTNPHGDRSKYVKTLATNLIRDLVGEWV